MENREIPAEVPEVADKKFAALQNVRGALSVLGGVEVDIYKVSPEEIKSKLAIIRSQLELAKDNLGGE